MKQNWINRWRTMAAAAGLAGFFGGCEAESNIPKPPSVVNRVSLQSFTGGSACQDLETYLEDTAVLQMRTQLEAARDGVPGWGWWGGWGRGGLEFDTAGGLAPASANSAQSAPTNVTTTNNQVAGVDEADFVKNDGTRIFALSGSTLHAVRSWPADQTAVQGTLKIEGYPREMFLDGTDKAVVFSSIYTWYPLSNAGGVSCLGLHCGYSYANTVKVTEVDVSDLTNLRVTRESFLPGNYESARKIGASVRLVLSDSFNFPPGFKWSPDWDENLWNDKPRLRAAYNRIIAQNETLIRSQTLAEWVPAAKIKTATGTTLVPHACDAFARVNAPTRLGQVSVVTLDLDASSLHRTSILAEPGEIYSSADNLYVATRHWWWWPAPGQRDTTYVHKFDITQPGNAVYVASGTVDGHIVDQFSMDEAASGHLRVVTTIQTRVPDTTNPDNWWGTMQTTNRLSVLGENAGYLDVVGQSPDLAEGERVMSSRMIGDRGFVVTFRQVDPLFTFDLSDPTNPRKIAELKIPGFSTYIHPMDATHLLTIGTYVPEPVNGQQPDWSARALQLAIFDVTDLAHPVQTHTQLVGTAYGWSEAANEHKAFNYFAAKKLLAIPFADWSNTGSGDYWNSFRSDLKVYSVDPLLGFTARGSVSMADMYQVQQYAGWTYYWQPYVRRSVMADDFVYAISDSGIRVANVANLSAPIATTRFNRYQEE
ncbi:MAG: beta-propeller domain-containing protein [Archangium sp.]|nr:beta-propeller domain-containing protein [Archangium sp.]MDP3570719.1 beta-propeller domain-containing protein [Archangium sp.]